MYLYIYIIEIEKLDLNSKDTHELSKSKNMNEIRIEPPVPVEHIIKTKVETKEEPALKVDSGNTISKDAIKKEDEELAKRPEIELLEKLKNHENEEKKILAESKQILEELKGARQKQFEKNIKKPNKHLQDLNNLNIPEDKNNISEKKHPIEDVVKDKLPLPLVLKEAKKSNKTKMETNRDKRDLSSTVNHGNDTNKKENCDKNDNEKKYDENVNVNN